MHKVWFDASGAQILSGRKYLRTTKDYQRKKLGKAIANGVGARFDGGAVPIESGKLNTAQEAALDGDIVNPIGNGLNGASLPLVGRLWNSRSARTLSSAITK